MSSRNRFRIRDTGILQPSTSKTQLWSRQGGKRPALVPFTITLSTNARLTTLSSHIQQPQSWVSLATPVTSAPPLVPSAPTTVRTLESPYETHVHTF